MRIGRSLAIAAGVAGSALTPSALIAETKPTLPPYAGAYEPQTVDERGVWMQADEDERGLRDSQFLINDPALSAYVRAVLCRTVGADRCRGVRLYIERVPAFNATMAPNGTLRVWTGMLLRLRNEAELAAVLAHEFAHFERRHSLAEYRHNRGATDVMAWAGLIGGAVSSTVFNAALLSIPAFSRAEETEADMLSARYIAAAGYDVRCFADVWARLMDEADATALGRHQRSRRYDRVAFFASHPTNLDRAIYLRDFAARQPIGGDTGQDAWSAALTPWRAGLLADQLKLNDFGGTEYVLGQLGADGWSEDLLFARAELYRTRGNPRDLVTAANLYRQAIAIDPAHVDSYRGLGLALIRSGDAESGRAALRRYLYLAPGADDASMLASLLS